MFFTLPSKYEIDDFFGRLRALLWGAFEVLLLILAMVAVALFAWSHIPNPTEKTVRGKDRPAHIPARGGTLISTTVKSKSARRCCG
ncbi:hypothetical protein SBA4_6880005 [Candidatus Sulfopaludibacter sp. SbA4]|nr:hypothetical protein SBA4_6880005 [Candidatus Sulfopaludibacter sp. SbA4]